MNLAKHTILEVVLATPVRRSFDYLLPNGNNIDHKLLPGSRVLVDFGPRKRIALIIAVKDCSELKIEKLKPCLKILDKQPLLDESLLNLAKWASTYYHYYLGEICFKMLPAALRKHTTYQIKQQKFWKTTDQTPSADTLKRAPKQQHCIELVSTHLDGISDQTLKDAGIKTAQLTHLKKQGWLEECFQDRKIEIPIHKDKPAPTLNTEQQLAIEQCQLDSFNVHLLDGVTGSGKTEVYLRLIEKKLAEGKQILVLVPEIGLTPQLVKRFEQRLKIPIAVLHSGLNNQQRLENWLLTVEGKYPILIGTRSALFTPMKNLGLIIIDEEHDPSFKQQQGWQYSARDLALVRARDLDIPVILGTATPSLETLYHAINNKYHHLKLTTRPASSVETSFKILDIRKLPIQQGLSKPLIDSISEHLSCGNQVIVFLNRRGYAPVLMCHDCGWMASCQRCDINYTLHQSPKHLHCHHCSGSRPVPKVCPDCQSSNMTAVGLGTERVESLLKDKFPDYPLVRIDRDSTRRKGSMKQYIDDINSGRYKILIGTQMLSKGHHFPDVSLVAIIDMDGALFSSDFRAAEKFGQLLTQIAGRAGREDKAGTVMLQTHHPEHPQLQTLIADGYAKFAQQLLEERKQCLWPPYSYLAMFRAEATEVDKPELFLQQIADFSRQYIDPTAAISVLGPVAAPMPMRAGKYRYQLLLQATSRQSLQNLLRQIVFCFESEKIAKTVRWSIDVDPLEMF